MKQFSSNKIDEFMNFVNENNLVEDTIHATGGGAYKYNHLFKDNFESKGVKVLKHDEMGSLVNGMSFALQYAKNPSFFVS